MARKVIPVTPTERLDAARKLAAGDMARTYRLARTMLIDVVVDGARAVRQVPLRQGAK